MLCVMLTSEDHAAVQGMRRARPLSPTKRVRVEMVHLVDAG